MILDHVSLQGALVFAALIGVVGPILAALSTGALGQRALFARLRRDRSAITVEQANGTFSRAFAPFVVSGAGSLPLSPDAVAGAIRASIEKSREAALGRLKPWSYLPLMGGLLITAVSLRSVLALARAQGTVGPELTEEMGRALLGTVAGVAAALLASLAQGFSSRPINRAAADAEQYLYEVFVPRLPSLRVKLHFDEEVLKILGERTAAVVEEYRLALQPLVDSLASSATESVASAKAAQEAFAEVAVAVKNAKAIKDACAKLAAASQYSEQTAVALAAQVEPVSTFISKASELQLASMKNLETVGHGVTRLADSTDALRSAIVEKPDSITKTAVEIATGLKQAEQATKQLREASEHLGSEVIVLRQTVANLGDAKLEKWTEELRRSVAEMNSGLKDAVAGLPAGASQEMDRLGISSEKVLEAVKKVAEELKHVKTALVDVEATATTMSPAGGNGNGATINRTPLSDRHVLSPELGRLSEHSKEMLALQQEIRRLLAQGIEAKRRRRWNPFRRRTA